MAEKGDEPLRSQKSARTLRYSFLTVRRDYQKEEFVVPKIHISGRGIYDQIISRHFSILHLRPAEG